MNDIKYTNDLEYLSRNELIIIIQNLHWYFDLKFKDVNEILDNKDKYI